MHHSKLQENSTHLGLQPETPGNTRSMSPSRKVQLRKSHQGSCLFGPPSNKWLDCLPQTAPPGLNTIIIINTLFIHDYTFSKAGGVVYVSRCMRCCLQYVSNPFQIIIKGNGARVCSVCSLTIIYKISYDVVVAITSVVTSCPVCIKVPLTAAFKLFHPPGLNKI